MDTIKNLGGRAVGVFAALGTMLAVGVALAGSASATDPVSTAFDDMETKVTTYGTAIVALVVLAVGIFLGIKYLRRGVSKA